ncbi:MAG: tyrosine-type recombinase/integrase [Chloroflexi bacterium]|nr:tyrosine-type recombinase/integrase [Chloroflexota bacterium]
MALDEKKRLEALEITDRLTRPSNTQIVPFLQSFGEFLRATRTRKSAKNDLSYLRLFFGPCCEALQLGSKVPHKFRQAQRSLPTVPDQFGKLHVPVKRLEQISAEMIGSFIQNRIVKDRIAPKTANRVREVLHRMFSYAIEQHGYVCPDPRHRNPAKGVRRIREPAPTITWLTHEDIDRQLAVLEDHPQLRAMVAMYIYAGLRREEALWLVPKDVDLDARMICVRAKQVQGQSWQPKTKRNRSVPISQDLLAILEVYQPRVASPWFFPGPTGGRWDPDNFSQDIREINRPAGLVWSCLDFRHTFGSHLAQKGESLFKIAELMGNSPEICKRHYAALVPEKMRDTVEFARPPAKDASDEGSASEIVKQLLEKIERLESERRRQPHPRLRIAR